MSRLDGGIFKLHSPFDAHTALRARSLCRLGCHFFVVPQRNGERKGTKGPNALWKPASCSPRVANVFNIFARLRQGSQPFSPRVGSANASPPTASRRRTFAAPLPSRAPKWRAWQFERRAWCAEGKDEVPKLILILVSALKRGTMRREILPAYHRRGGLPHPPQNLAEKSL